MLRMLSLVVLGGSVALVCFTGACSSDSPAPATDAGSSGTSTASSSGGSSGGNKCVGPGGSTSGGLQQCTSTGEWKCGGDSYDVECECPTAQCHCKKNGSLVKSVPFAGCKSDGNCDASLVPAGECGVPL